MEGEWNKGIIQNYLETAVKLQVKTIKKENEHKMFALGLTDTFSQCIACIKINDI